MSTFAPSGSVTADPDSTPSESTVPSTDSPTPPDDRSHSAAPGVTVTDPDDPNTSWDINDPNLPAGLKP